MLFLALLASAPEQPDPDILVTASRAPVRSEESGVSATVIDAERIEALGATQAIDLLRLVPGVSVAVSGARGNQAQLRIRGGEANHSLLFIDGIRLTDPAAANEARFEILSTDALGAIEVVRGPQSALWGSEALGGVVALRSPDPSPGLAIGAIGEYGSHDSLRAGADLAYGGERVGVTASAARNRSDGIDVLGGGNGDRDGYRNDTLALRAVARPSGDSEVGLAARYIHHVSQFDGNDPLTFRRADTLDNSTTETATVRGHASFGVDPASAWGGTVQAQYLDSSNRNRDHRTALRRTHGSRFGASAQLERRLEVGASRHVLIGAAEYEDEDFRARDQNFGGFTDQDQRRDRTAYVGEWRAQWSDRFSTDFAVRHDDFSAFADETTFRATALLGLTDALSFNASYGEGIAQPTFTDLFGFFPGSFVGNPTLQPETSRGFELGVRYARQGFSLAAAAFDNRLRNEIVGTLDPDTFLASTANATGKSKRRGIELAGDFEPAAGLRLSANYTYLDAEDQQVAGAARLREVRRPRHSANAAFDYRGGPLTLGGSLAYVGTRRDTDFDLFSAPVVRLGDYLLASLRVGYRITEALEAFGRVENIGDAEYQDVVGYATPGRTVHAGLRLRFGA